MAGYVSQGACSWGFLFTCCVGSFVGKKNGDIVRGPLLRVRCGHVRYVGVAMFNFVATFWALMDWCGWVWGALWCRIIIQLVMRCG